MSQRLLGPSLSPYETGLYQLPEEVVDVAMEKAWINLEVVTERRKCVFKRLLCETCEDTRANFVQTEVLLGLEVEQHHLAINLAAKHLGWNFHARPVRCVRIFHLQNDCLPPASSRVARRPIREAGSSPQRSDEITRSRAPARPDERVIGQRVTSGVDGGPAP